MAKPKGFRKSAGVKVKMKTHKGAAKRFKMTGSGKIFKFNTGHQHNLGIKKSARRKRRLRQSSLVSARDVNRLRRMLPYE